MYISTLSPRHGELLTLAVEGAVEFGGFELSPYVLADFDFDYVNEDYDGLNHIEVGVSTDIPFPGDRSLTAYISYSNAQENLRRDDATDHNYLWAGISLPL